MPDPIFVEGGILIPAEALEMRAVRASGPGGQNVNKVASKIELRVNLNAIHGLDPESRQRLNRLVAKRLDSNGKLVVTSQRTRDQFRNLDDARRKVHDWIARAIKPPRKRVVSRQPDVGSRERRLAEKHRQAMRKLNRRPVASGEEE